MCGIAGLIVKQESTGNIQEQIRQMVQIIEHRGPDGEGIYCYQNLGLGHRRLAIIDPSPEGHQPMVYQNGDLVITYNGEIYNYLELRQELTQLGHRFHSNSDTEVILAAYAQWGESCVNRFNGMWAFALFDKPRNLIFCSRDRFGVKPFYYINTPNLFAFGSEIKQLIPYLGKVKANQEALLNFVLTTVSDQSNQTFFQDVVKLPAGHNLIYSLANHRIRCESWYELNLQPHYLTMTAEEAIESYLALLENAIALRLRADVAVGTCLSGGLDSSSVASLAAPMYRALSGQSFSGITAVSQQESNNEADYARQVIEYSSMNWLQVCPTYQDFQESLPHLVWTQEEPFGSTSLTMQYFVMKTARANGIPVLLDGQGGDETLLGYDKYYGSHLVTTLRQQGLSAFVYALRTAGSNNKKLSLTHAMKYLIAGTLAPLRYQYYCHKHRYLANPPACPSHLSAYSRSIWNAFQLQKLEVESTNLPVLLRYEDKNSMAHSIETRLPFLDYRVLEAALSLPLQFKIKDGWSKWLLRRGMENRMPDTIVWRKNKFGFEAPETLWMNQHAPEMQAVVQASPLLAEVSRPKAMEKHFASLDKRSQWRLYSIALWEKTFGVSA
jgi:asparagine synthase (glutamine-hydrolysing)